VRALALGPILPIDVMRAECEAAVKLLSLLAYGQPDALSVKVLERLP
jgi:hypothetical protein